MFAEAERLLSLSQMAAKSWHLFKTIKFKGSELLLLW